MHIVKISKNVYEVRRYRYERPLFRGTINECTEFMRINTMENYDEQF